MSESRPQDAEETGTRPVPCRRRPLLRTLALRAVVLVATLLFLEVAFRAVVWLQGAPYGAAAARERILELRDIDQLAILLPEADGRVRREPAPEIEPVLHPFLGFAARGRTAAVEAELARLARGEDDGSFRILILGGSVAGMFGVHGGERLHELLRADPRLEGRPIHHIPLASGGHKQPQQLIRLILLLSEGIVPDAVINIDGYNELVLGSNNVRRQTNPIFPSSFHWTHLARDGARERPILREMFEVYGAQRETARLAGWMLDARLYHSSILGRLGLARLEALKGRIEEGYATYLGLVEEGGERGVLHGPAFDRRGVAPLRAIVRHWEEASTMIDQLCRARSIPYLHVLQPTLLDEGSKPLKGPERGLLERAPAVRRLAIRAGYPRLREAGRRLAASGVHFLDASMVFAEATERLYQDDCHFRERGSAILAEPVAEALLRALD